MVYDASLCDRGEQHAYGGSYFETSLSPILECVIGSEPRRFRGNCRYHNIALLIELHAGDNDRGSNTLRELIPERKWNKYDIAEIIGHRAFSSYRRWHPLDYPILLPSDSCQVAPNPLARAS